jgi:hypothetical protein
LSRRILDGLLWSKTSRNFTDTVQDRDDDTLTEWLGKLDFLQRGYVPTLNEFGKASLEWIIILALCVSS